MEDIKTDLKEKKASKIIIEGNLIDEEEEEDDENRVIAKFKHTLIIAESSIP